MEEIPTRAEITVASTGTHLPSEFNIGDPVSIRVQGLDIEGWIRAVIHTNAKVRYSVRLIATGSLNDDGELDYTTFHNLDSYVVHARDGEKMEWGPDNYS